MGRLIILALVLSLVHVQCLEGAKRELSKGSDEARLRILLEEYAEEYRGERSAVHEIELPNKLEGPSRDLKQIRPGATFTTSPVGRGMSFDGFNFGYGGLLPQIIGGFSPIYYQALFTSFLNLDWLLWFSGTLPNRIDPLDFIPLTNGLGIDLRNRYGRDVVSLVGQDWADQILASVYTRPSVKLGDIIPSGCVGPTYQLRLDGGRCTVSQQDHEVECTRPSIRFQILPLTCNLKYKAACGLTGDSWRFVKRFGRVRRDVIGERAAVYNYGYALNVTQAFLGFGLTTRRVLQDFGVIRWYNYLNAIIGLELVRIIDFLFGGFSIFFPNDLSLGTLGAQNLAGQPGGAGTGVGTRGVGTGTGTGTGTGGVGAGTGIGAVPVASLQPGIDVGSVSPMVRDVAEWLNERGAPGNVDGLRPSAGLVNRSDLGIPYRPSQTARNAFKRDSISTIDIDKLLYNKEQLDQLQGSFHVSPDGQRKLDFQKYALEEMAKVQPEVTDVLPPPKTLQQPLADNVFVSRASSSFTDPEVAAFLGTSVSTGSEP